MRDISFRGKRMDTGEWVCGDLIREPYGTCIQYVIETKPCGAGAPERKPTTQRHKATIDPATVGQLVKVTKKARFYEGDIITSRRYPFQDNGNYVYHGVIEWSNEDLAFFLVLRLADFERRGISNGIGELLSGYTLEGFYKLGNIHDNPELLEVKP